MKKQVKKELLWLCGLSALALYATRNRRAAVIPAALGGLLALQKHTDTDFRGHSVVITGGSRGLGFALAKQLLAEHANVTLLARDQEELHRAQALLQKGGRGRVHIIQCDVTENFQLRSAFEEVYDIFGGIDMLINNAGSITVGPFETMKQEDFEAQMRLHVYAPLNAIQLCLPYLRAQDSGKRIVNICSMGGRVAVPHMVPYDTSKFALSGLSQGIGAELATEGISVTTIYPTLMRTGSPIQAVFKGDHEKEFRWFQVGDVFPGLSMSAEDAAEKIVEAARDRRWELMPSGIAKLRMSFAVIFPECLSYLMILMNKLLPKGQSQEYKTGAESRELFESSVLTQPFLARAKKAEAEHNQEHKSDARFNMGLH